MILEFTKSETLIFYSIITITSTFMFYLWIINKKKIFLIISFLILWIIASFRYNVGSDYEIYLFQSAYFISMDPFLDNIPSINLGMRLLYAFSNMLGSEKTFFLTSSFIILFNIFFGINLISSRYNNNKVLIFYLITILFFFVSFNIIKQSISISFYFLSVLYALKKKSFLSLFLFLISLIFHEAALIGLIGLIVIINKKLFIPSIIFFLLIFLFFNQISIFWIAYRLPGFEYFIFVPSSNREFYINLALIFLVLVSLIINNKKPINNFESILLFLFLIGLFINLVGFYNIYLKRLSIYYNFFVFIVPLIILNRLYSKFDKFIIKLSFYSLFSLLAYYTFFILEQSNLVPYSFKFSLLDLLS